MRLAIDLGGTPAREMLARQLRHDTPIHALDLGPGSLAVTERAPTSNEGDVFVTIGTPIRKVDASEIVDARSAAERLPEQDGAFASIHWSSAERKLTVVTDFLGFKPLYIRKTPGRLQLASETKAWNAPPDPAGWGAFVSFGHTIGDRTLLEGVQRVRPATILVYEPDSDRLTERTYWKWPSPASQPDIGGLVEALEDSVGEYSNYGAPGTLLLSGGFDSRLIACLLKRAGIPTKALSVSHADELLDADSRFAETFARRQGIPFQRVRSPEDFFSSQAYLDYLFDSDAATPSLYLFISQVAQFVNSEPVWEGLIPGCTLTTLHQPPGGFAEYLRQECRDRDSTAWCDAQSIFRKGFCDAMLEGFESDLANEVARYTDTGHGVTEFVIRNRARNRTSINPLKVYEARTRAFLPGLTKAYFDLAGSVSFEARQDNAMYLELPLKHFPEALCCPIVSGSTLVKPSPWSMSYYAMRAATSMLRWVSLYPNLARRIGLDPARRAFLPSRLLEPSMLFDESDPWINSSQIMDLARRGQLPGSTSKLWFHWTAWRRLHDGRLGSAS